MLEAVVWEFRDTVTASCVLLLFISTGTLPSQLTCPCLAAAWKKGCYKRALLSRQAAVKDLPVELRTWEERSPSLPSDFPAPSPGPVPASSWLPSLPSRLQHADGLWPGWSGEQISSTLTIGFLLCFLLSQWVEIISVGWHSPRNCSSHTAVEAKSWECGQERAGRKRNIVTNEHYKSQLSLKPKYYRTTTGLFKKGENSQTPTPIAPENSSMNKSHLQQHFSIPPLPPQLCQRSFSRESVGSENGSRLSINKNKKVISIVEQFTSPAHHMAVNNFLKHSWRQRASVGMSGCGWVQQDAELLLPVLPFKGTPTQPQPPLLSKSGLSNFRWQAPEFVCLLSCIIICLVQSR